MLIFRSQHIDRDLKPYICLSEECLDAQTAFPTFNQWYRHMELHDGGWHQKVYLTSSWVCPFCGLSNTVYNSPQALYSHLTESHGEDFTSLQLQAISRQSKVEQPRAWNDCLLCCFTIEERKSVGESIVSKRQKRQPNQEAFKSNRKNLEMTSPDPHGSDLDLLDTSDSDNADSHQRRRKRQDLSNAVARHIATHLQTLMLLTLRFAALQSDDEGLDDDITSNSADIDERNSANSEDTDLGRISQLKPVSEGTIEGDTNDVSNKESFTQLDGDNSRDDAAVVSRDPNFAIGLKYHDDLEAKNGEDTNNVAKWLSHVGLWEDADTNEDGDLATSNSDGRLRSPRPPIADRGGRLAFSRQLAPQQEAQLNPRYRVSYERPLARRDETPPTPTTRMSPPECLRHLWKLGQEEQKRFAQESMPDIPMSPEEYAEIAAKLRQIVLDMDKVGRGLNAWYLFTESDSRAKRFYRAVSGQKLRTCIHSISIC